MQGYHIRLCQCFLSIVQHLAIILIVKLNLAESEIRGGCTFTWEIQVLVLDGLQKTFLCQFLVTTGTANGAQYIGRGIKSKLAVMLSGILVYLLSLFNSFLTVDTKEGIDSFVAPCLIEQTFVIGG